jgi:elongation factor 1-alpha
MAHNRVTDDGRLLGTERAVLEGSVACLQRMCCRVGAQIVALERFPVAGGAREVAEAHIKAASVNRADAHEPSAQVTEEIRVVFLGDAGVGKSTLLGILAYGGLDNGAGSVRMGLLRHRHEILSGHTTSVSVEPLVFMQDSGDGGSGLVPIRPEEFESTEHLTLTLQRRYMDAPKVIQFFDMPGKPRLHRAVLASLTSMAGPDLVCIVVAATGEADEDRLGCIEECLAVLEPLGIRVLVVITKTDLVHSDELAAIEHGIRERFGLPCFAVSALTGTGVESLVYVLLESSPVACVLPTSLANSLFLVEAVKELEGVGTVLKGTVLRGALETSGTWHAGPHEDGSFRPVPLKTIHRLRIPAQRVDARLMASVAVCAGETGSIKRGMFLTNGDAPAPLAMQQGFATRRCPAFLRGLDKPLKGVLVLNGARYPASLTMAGAGTRVDLEDGDQRVFLMPGMKFILATHLGILSGLI